MNAYYHNLIDKYYTDNKSYTETAKLIKEKENISISVRQLRRLVSTFATYKQAQQSINQDKESKVSWHDISKWINAGKELKTKLYGEEKDFYSIDLSHIDYPILLVPLSDLHFGGWGTDYKQLEKITKEILSIPEIFVTLDGDIIENAIHLRNVREVMGNAISPKMQLEFLESWVDEIQHKILWAGWGNHETMREEKVLGYSPVAKILKNRLIPFNDGIAHIDLQIGKEVYKIVSSHFFRGNSYLNVAHSQQRYMRFQGIDREIAIAGHTHTPGFNWYFDGPMQRLAINTGTLNTKSIYARRHYSLFTFPVFPVIELFNDEHRFIPYASIENWKKSKQ